MQLYGASSHKSVVRVTDGVVSEQGTLTDALLGMRWGSQKMLGTHAGVVAEAGHAAREGESTNVAVRCAAIFNWCHSLTWSGQFDELRSAFEGYFRPTAMIADSRWMAWADYVEACLLLAQPDSDIEAGLARIDSAIERFKAEGHLTALASIRTVQLSALRLQNDVPRYLDLADDLVDEDERNPLPNFGRQWLMLELAQGLAYRLDDLHGARRTIEVLCESEYPVLAVAASALRGQLEPDESLSREYLQRARESAHASDFYSIAAFCDRLLNESYDTKLSTELVFP